jgi:hypothetical protein
MRFITVVDSIASRLALPGTARQLALVRIILLTTLAISLVSTNYVAIGEHPAELLAPISFALAFDRLPSAAVTASIQVLGVVAAILGAVAVVPRLTAPAALVCAVILGTIASSTGKVTTTSS